MYRDPATGAVAPPPVFARQTRIAPTEAPRRDQGPCRSTNCYPCQQGSPGAEPGTLSIDGSRRVCPDCGHLWCPDATRLGGDPAKVD